MITKLQKIVSIFVVMLSLLSPIQADANERDLASYTNSRFGFTLYYPRDIFISKRLSDNGDGITLYGSDRNLELRAYGSSYGDSIRSIYHDEVKWARESGKNITYKVLKRDWFVISGYENGGKMIFYKKTYFRGEDSVSFRLIYPTAKKDRYNNLVSTINRNFNPNLY